MVLNAATVRFRPAGDRALLVSFGEAIDRATQARVASLTRDLQNSPLHGVINLHPAYCSVLVVFDPLETDHGTIERALSERLANNALAVSWQVKRVEVPVCYGGDFGPDLRAVAALNGLTPAAVIELHAAAEYSVHFLGFVPGFAYLGGLPPGLATPRLDVPRPRVPAGSVGIAGAQTGVYPFATPGGWRLIGRTPLRLFRTDRDPMSLLSIGDSVRFVPITEERFDTWQEAGC